MIIHVIPLNDLKEHKDTDIDCWCQPRIEYEGNGEIVIHNSLDGREGFETGERKLS